MRFVWDERKSRRNLVKHHVSFELASLVFDDPWHVRIFDPHEMKTGGERWAWWAGASCF